MKSGLAALAYLLVFGVGTVVGMMIFSIAISVPLQFSARRLRRTTIALQALLGVANLALGIWIAGESLAVILSK
jgi:high-affinity nickel-transport protein